MGPPLVVDTSVLIAILASEPEADALTDVLRDASSIWIGSPTRLEAGIVAMRRFPEYGLVGLAELCAALAVDTVGFGPRHAAVAEQAYQRFGKGRHPAALNLGDCCAYAAARIAERPLLYRGRDFSQTDISTVPWANSGGVSGTSR